MTFKAFFENHGLLNLNIFVQRNPLFSMRSGSFNAKSSYWFYQDKTRFEVDAIDDLIRRFGLH